MLCIYVKSKKMVDATTLRCSNRASKPLLQWIPQPNAPSKRIKKQSCSDLESVSKTLPDTIPTINNRNTTPIIPKLPTEILQLILSFTCRHPNNLIRLMGVCSSFNQTIKSHPIWRQYMIQWKIPFMEPMFFDQDYHKEWRRYVVVHAKQYCELCSNTATIMGRHESDTYRVRLCEPCFNGGFIVFKARHGGEKRYTMYAKKTLIQKESLDCIYSDWWAEFVAREY
ncbi:hypothetical protein BDR26DRAFT_693224 [Obelidium mucronatum]|nr:hypothetical protein BDR26DRAFT_693224 [Obelidium mucronatum]